MNQRTAQEVVESALVPWKMWQNLCRNPNLGMRPDETWCLDEDSDIALWPLCIATRYASLDDFTLAVGSSRRATKFLVTAGNPFVYGEDTRQFTGFFWPDGKATPVKMHLLPEQDGSYRLGAFTQYKVRDTDMLELYLQKRRIVPTAPCGAG